MQPSLFLSAMRIVFPIGFIVLVVLSVVESRILQGIVENQLRQNIAELGKREAALIGERFNGLKNIAKTLAKNDLTINGLIDVGGRESYLPAFYRSLNLPASAEVTVSLVDYKGRVVASNRQGVSSEKLTDVATEQVIVREDGLLISEPVLYSGTAEGAVVLRYSPTAYPTLLGTSVSGESFFLTSKQGIVLYSNNQALAITGEKTPEMGNRDWVHGTYPLAQGGMSVTVASSLEKALEPLETLNWILFMGMSVFLLTAIALIVFSALAVSRPLNRLARDISTIEDMSDLDQALDASGPKEIAKVAQTFNGMLGKLKETSVSKEFVDNILGSISDGIITIDQSGKIRSFNEGAQHIFGYAMADVINMNVSILLPIKERTEHEFYTANSRLSAPRIINQHRDLVGRRKDGSFFPMELIVTPMQIDGERGFVGTLRDITERKEIERLKNEFVSTVSHELRTPLTSIKGSLGLVAGGAVGELPEKAMKMVDVAYKNSDRLIRLVNDILDMEKLVSGKMEFHFEKLDMVDLLVEAIKINQGYADEFQVRFSSFEAIEGAQIWGDRDRLHQVLANLLSNAAKFSPRGGAVDLDLSRVGDTVRVSVSDQGPGIPDAFRDKIFERFSQADASDTRQLGGTGLGLNISKSIVEKHGGEIGFETSLGEGTKFFFDIPRLKPGMEKRRRATDKSTKGIFGGSHHVQPNEVKDVSRSKNTEASDLPRVLYLEDDPDLVNVVASLLEKSCDIVVAETLAKAKDLIQSQKYDLAIIDIGLPDGSGLDLIDELKLNENSSTPVIVFSAQEVGSDITNKIAAAMVKSKTTNEQLAETVKSLIYFKA